MYILVYQPWYTSQEGGSKMKLALVIVLFSFCVATAVATNTTNQSCDWMWLFEKYCALETGFKIQAASMPLPTSCPIPQTLTDLQTTQRKAYALIEGRSDVSLNEFAKILSDCGWKGEMVLVEYDAQTVDITFPGELTKKVPISKGKTIFTVSNNKRYSWDLEVNNVNLPFSISGCKKSIEYNGGLDSTSQKPFVIGKVVVTRRDKYIATS